MTTSTAAKANRNALRAINRARDASRRRENCAGLSQTLHNFEKYETIRRESVRIAIEAARLALRRAASRSRLQLKPHEGCYGEESQEGEEGEEDSKEGQKVEEEVVLVI